MVDVKNLPPAKKVKRAKVQLQDDTPFFGYLIMHSQFKPAPEMRHYAGAHPNGYAYYSPKKIADLPIPVIKGIVVHETMHFAFHHVWRDPGNRNHQLLNDAEDCVINHMIDGRFPLPDNTLTPDDKGVITFERGDCTIEIRNASEKDSLQVYNEIVWQIENQREEQKSGDEGGEGPDIDLDTILGGGQDESEGSDEDESEGTGGGSEKEADEDDEDEDESEGNFEIDMPDKEGEDGTNVDWDDVLAGAVQHTGRQAGVIPKGIERKIEDILGHKIGWREQLQKYVTDRLPRGRTWKKPSRHSHSVGMYLPGRDKGEQLNITVSVDASGSISQETLSKFKDDLIEIARSYSSVDIRIFSHDTNIYNDEGFRVHSGNVEKLREWEPSGGGGTDLIKPFKYVERKHRKTDVLVLLTDGKGPRPGHSDSSYQPRIDHVWVLAGQATDNEIKTGRVIRVNK